MVKLLYDKVLREQLSNNNNQIFFTNLFSYGLEFIKIGGFYITLNFSTLKFKKMYHKQAYCADSAHHPRHHFKRKIRKMMAHKFGHHHRGGHFPKVNVQELDDRYELFVYAAGYSKADFKVDLSDNTLIIAATNTSKTESNYNWRRQEFRPRKFERQFELNEKIDKESITAKYEDGILKVTLSKLEGFETMRREVEIN